MRKKKRKYWTLARPSIVFTLETITVAQKALKLLEQSLQRLDSSSLQAAFAKETMKQVKGKLNMMSMSTSHTELTTFDYNEMIVLATAAKLYMLDLCCFPSTPHRARELRQCRLIATYFANPKASALK